MFSRDQAANMEGRNQGIVNAEGGGEGGNEVNANQSGYSKDIEDKHRYIGR